MDDMRVWIGCLACYNEGVLSGEWFDADEAGSVELAQVCRYKAAAERAFHEEMWVMDHEGFDGWLKGECSPYEAQRIADMVASIPEYERGAVAAWRDLGNDVDEWDAPTEESFHDAYRGEWEREEDYACDFYEECYGPVEKLPDMIRYSINWESVAEWLELTTVPTGHGGVYIFTN